MASDSPAFSLLWRENPVKEAHISVSIAWSSTWSEAMLSGRDDKGGFRAPAPAGPAGQKEQPEQADRTLVEMGLHLPHSPKPCTQTRGALRRAGAGMGHGQWAELAHSAPPLEERAICWQMPSSAAGWMSEVTEVLSVFSQVLFLTVPIHYWPRWEPDRACCSACEAGGNAIWDLQLCHCPGDLAPSLWNLKSLSLMSTPVFSACSSLQRPLRTHWHLLVLHPACAPPSSRATAVLWCPQPSLSTFPFLQVQVSTAGLWLWLWSAWSQTVLCARP